jgi:hypothetical protein
MALGTYWRPAVMSLVVGFLAGFALTVSAIF